MIPGLLAIRVAPVPLIDLGSVRGLYLETGLQSLADQWPGCFMQKGPQACWRALPTLHDGAAALPGGASNKPASLQA